MNAIFAAIITFSFVLTTDPGGETIQGRGTVEPWSRYNIEIAGGSRIVCDSTALYLIDNNAKEIYVQDPQPLDIKQLKTLLSGKKHIEGKYVDNITGQNFKYVVNCIAEIKDAVNFSPALGQYGTEWIITDLRQ